MKRWLCGLAAFGSLVCLVHGQEISWRPAKSTPSASAPTAPNILGKPQAVSAGQAAGASVVRGKLIDDPPPLTPIPYAQGSQERSSGPPTQLPSAAEPVSSGMQATPRANLSPGSTEYKGSLASGPNAFSNGWVYVDGSGRCLNDVCLGMPCQRLYFQGEYLFWWTRGQNIPPLVTTAPASAPEDTRGTLGAPGTQILFGGNRVSTDGQSGGRFTLGYWFDECCECAVEGSYFFLSQGNHGFDADSSQFPVLARPFFNINTGQQDRQLTASPGTSPGDAFNLKGNIAVALPSQLQGAELNLKALWCESCNYRVNVLVGFRYLNLREGVNILESGTSLQAVEGTNLFDPGTRFFVHDDFDTRNTFYGGQIGASIEWQRDRWFVEARCKLGLGLTHQEININGGQTFIAPNGTQSNFTGGLLALPSNIGHFGRDRFSFVPELGLKLGYQVNENIRVYVGYDILYWTGVLRPGDQIDTTLNSNLIPNFNLTPVPTPPSAAFRPAVLFRTSDFWAQGVSAGVEIRY